jgi:uncharacterized membrane protein (UPF0127 family)
MGCRPVRTLRILLAASVAALLLGSCTPQAQVVELRLGSTVFTVEVARTAAQRQKGLMGRSRMGEQQGMLFVFDADETLNFWMKDTQIPLSIAFISSSGTITEIRDMRPLSEDIVHARLKCRYALEVNQGAFARAGVGEGDTVGFPEGFR